MNPSMGLAYLGEDARRRFAAYAARCAERKPKLIHGLRFESAEGFVGSFRLES